MSRGLRPGMAHLIGCAVAFLVAAILLTAFFPRVADIVFPRPPRPVGLRGEAIDFLLLALVPVVVWLVPPLMRALARATHHAHRLMLGRNGFYVRFPTSRPVRFRDTVVHAFGPFAIDLVVIAEIEYYFAAPTQEAFARALFSIPFLFLAGIITSLLPGGWLVDALELRLVNPSKGEVVREAALFEGILGPIGAIALLVSFVTLAHALGDSYEAALVLLALWATRIFPAVLAAVAVYRILVEPDVLPGLRSWADREGIPVAPAMERTLRGFSPANPQSSPTPDSAEAVGHEGREQGDEPERPHDD
mgnify:CR=1 FL=1